MASILPSGYRRYWRITPNTFVALNGSNYTDRFFKFLVAFKQQLAFAGWTCKGSARGDYPNNSYWEEGGMDGIDRVVNPMPWWINYVTWWVVYRHAGTGREFLWANSIADNYRVWWMSPHNGFVQQAAPNRPTATDEVSSYMQANDGVATVTSPSTAKLHFWARCNQLGVRDGQAIRTPN